MFAFKFLLIFTYLDKHSTVESDFHVPFIKNQGKLTAIASRSTLLSKEVSKVKEFTLFHYIHERFVLNRVGIQGNLLERSLILTRKTSD